MKRARLLLSVVTFLVGVQDSFEECALHSIRGEPNYVCSSVNELEHQQNRELFNIVIHKYKTPPRERKEPNIKLILVEDGKADISADTFKLLKDIQKIFGQNQDAVTVPAGLLSYLKIQELNLQRNAIVDIEAGAFDNIENFKRLFITDNKLSEVKAGVFDNSPLDTLGLSNNRISFIEKNAFINMTLLKRLYLDGNQLSDFETEIVMNNPQKLEVLHLQNNALTEINKNTLKVLNNLKVLNLKNNRISQIASYTFDNLLNLEDLVLSNNLLIELNADIFPRNGLQELEKLHINNNRLSYLTTTLLEKLRNLKLIRMLGNPWQCPCFDAILTWLGEHDVQQKCDKDYYHGTRPVCIFDDVHPHTCDHSNRQTYYQKYNEINKKSPQSSPCEL